MCCWRCRPLRLRRRTFRRRWRMRTRPNPPHRNGARASTSRNSIGWLDSDGPRFGRGGKAMLIRRSESVSASRPSRPKMPSVPEALSRRSFLRASGVGATVGIAGLTLNGMQAASQRATQAAAPGAPVDLKKTICPFCSVGCSIWAEVQNGVWVGQEPVFESPINMGTHCAKGAATRELAHGERRLKYPTKMVGGQWQRISWDQAIAEIGDKLLQIRQESGPDSVFWCGSSKFSNEAAYLHREFVAMWGSNNVDHQARICHSTTVAGVASTYGYGAMTNSFNDIHNSKIMFLLGGNPAEADRKSVV